MGDRGIDTGRQKSKAMLLIEISHYFWRCHLNEQISHSYHNIHNPARSTRASGLYSLASFVYVTLLVSSFSGHVHCFWLYLLCLNVGFAVVCFANCQRSSFFRGRHRGYRDVIIVNSLTLLEILVLHSSSNNSNIICNISADELFAMALGFSISLHLPEISRLLALHKLPSVVSKLSPSRWKESINDCSENASWVPRATPRVIHKAHIGSLSRPTKHQGDHFLFFLTTLSGTFSCALIHFLDIKDLAENWYKPQIFIIVFFLPLVFLLLDQCLRTLQPHGFYLHLVSAFRDI